MAGALDFDGRVILVTGAGRGMGAAHARELAARGARVVVNDLGGAIEGGGSDPAPSEEIVAEIEVAGGIALANADTVATSEGCAAMVAAAVAEFGRLDGVLHNAGISGKETVAEMSEESYDALLRVHLYGAFNLTREAWPHLAADRGRVVYISSGAGFYGVPTLAHYASAKVGMIGLARVAAAEGKELGIAVNVLGVAAQTRMMQTTLAETPNLSAWFDRYMLPELPAAAAAWLLHPDCDASGGVYQCFGPHVSRVLIAETEGFTKLDVTAEDVRDHFDQVEDPANLIVPEDADDFHARMFGFIIGAGAEPPKPDEVAAERLRFESTAPGEEGE
jgi:NAD(P)-dependent dehydrogenase (short-subunit alcohol dehydrogenase family)